jgi:hypothetical protein
MKDIMHDLERGQAMMVATIFFLVISITIIFGLVGPIVREQKLVTQLFLSRQSYFLAEAGIEDVVYRIREGMMVGYSETLSLGSSSATTVTTDTAEGKEVVSTGIVSDTERKLSVRLAIGDGVAFHYGIQIGTGGFTLANNSGVNGNIFSNSTVIGSAGSFITGSVSAVNSVSGVEVGTGTTGDANAPSVTGSTVRGTLYCKTGSGNNKPCNTSGTNPSFAPLPIPDSQIEIWKDDAELGGVIVGNQAISGTTNVLGPTKITGNVTLGINSHLTVSGTLWITGNLILSNGSEIDLDPSYGASDGIIIVDGLTTLSNSSNFSGSGNPASYVMLLTTSTSANAITLQNNAGAAILYAPYGTVQISNNASINQVTAKTVALQNNAVIEYLQGHIDASFTSGPSGGYQITEWKEVE